MSPSTLATVLAVGLIAIAAGSRLSEVYRTASLQRAAAALGFRYEPRAGRFLTAGPGRLPLFRAGGVGRHLVTNGALSLFEYVALPAQGGELSLMGAAEAKGVPSFRLERKLPGVAALAYAGGEEVALDAPAAFYERFQLVAEDPTAVRERFTPEVVKALLADPSWSVECDGRWLVATRARAHLEPSQLGEQLSSLRALVSLFA